jgi:hypothetical protein
VAGVAASRGARSFVCEAEQLGQLIAQRLLGNALTQMHRQCSAGGIDEAMTSRMSHPK